LNWICEVKDSEMPHVKDSQKNLGWFFGNYDIFGIKLPLNYLIQVVMEVVLYI
jgi:hypothetical protein